ncbi:MAG: DUF6713 family protein [Alkalispirochaetaceae bacterium]
MHYEMDAIRCSEWRIFPVLSMIDDPHAFRFFVVAHLPMCYLIIWLWLWLWLVANIGGEELLWRG